MSANVSDGELFADLQVTMTEIVLVELLENASIATTERGEVNERILSTIKKMMKDRFSDEDIIKFLEDGFPRQINISSLRKVL